MRTVCTIQVNANVFHMSLTGPNYLVPMRDIDLFRTPYSRVVLHGTCLCECSCVVDGTCDPLGSVCHKQGFKSFFAFTPTSFPIFVSTLPQSTPPFPISIPERAGYVDT